MNSKLTGKRKGPIKSERNKAAGGSGGGASRDPVQASSAFHANRARNSSSSQTRSEPTKQTAEESEDDDTGDRDDVRSKTALSLATHPLPPLAALVDTLSQFSRLQRLDLSSIASSEANPFGLTRLDWLAKAVFRAQAKKASSGSQSSETFGDSLTWLDVSNNEELTSQGCVGLEAFEQLHVLTMSKCKLQELPLCINPLKNLRALVLNNNSLTELPSNFPHLPELNSLILSHNKLKSIPASLPASVPALKKLSLGHNLLTGPASLPDFSVCLSLRDVRINNNPSIRALPKHIHNWGKGADGNTAPGLELLELKDCGLESWESLSTLVPESKNPQPHGRKGLTQLLLKGNTVAQLDDYRERVLMAHPKIRVLDNERLRPREKPSSAKAVSQPDEMKASQITHEDAGSKNAKTTSAISDGALQAAEANLDYDVDPLIGSSNSGSDDEEAAQMAAEMRAMRRSHDHKSADRSTQQHARNNKFEREEDKMTSMSKHKRGTRSGKKSKGKDKGVVRDSNVKAGTEHVPAAKESRNKASSSTAEPFFESVDKDAEQARLAPMYQLKNQQKKIASGRTQLSDGVLEDVKEATLGKARRLESKNVQELEAYDAAEDGRHSPATSASHKKTKKKSRDVEQDRTKELQNTSVASIVDLRPKSRKRTNETLERDTKAPKKIKEDKTPITKTPFAPPKQTKSDHIGVGGDAWGSSGVWS